MDQRTRREFMFVARLPEMRVFWISLPLIVFAIAAVAYELESPTNWILSGLLLLLGILMYWNSYSAATSSAKTAFERNELRSIVFGLEDALIVYDKNFKILFYNPAAEKLFRIKPSAVLGKEITPQDAEREGWKLLAQVVFPSLAPTLVSRTAPGKYPQIFDISLATPALELRVLTSPIGDEYGELIGFMKIVRNRTREVAIIKSKDEFISVASHQLRTPITEINWAMEALSKDSAVSRDSEALIQQTASSAKTLLNIVDDLLNISKVEEGRFGYDFKPTDMVAFLGGILTTASPQIERAGIKLYFDRPKEPIPPILIDKPKLTMALSNLLDNAVRYNVQNGEITVGVRKVGDESVEIFVKDTGIGIPEDQVENIFNKFFRGSNAVKFQTEGSGLGLYIVKNIVETHGGQITVESELNRGTTLRFTLPVNFSPDAMEESP